MKSRRTLFVVYFSLFMMLSHYLCAMDGPAPGCPANLSLVLVLASLNNNKVKLDERMRCYSPTAILKGLNAELEQIQKSAPGFEQSLKNILLTAIFAVQFHGFLTGEIPDALAPFFASLNKVTAKNDFTGVPGLSSVQRKTLIALTKKDLKKMSNLCEIFFLGPQKQFIDPINKAIAGIEKEITARFLRAPTKPVFNTDLMQINTSFLDFALFFGSSNAVMICYAHANKFYAANNLDKAKFYYQKAADRGNLYAINALGVINNAQGKTEKAYEYLKAASDMGHAEAMYNFALLLIERGDNNTAHSLLERSADLGVVAAMDRFGLLLEKQGHKSLALIWYRRAAQKNYVGAMYNLGMLLEEMGNHKESRQWIEAAAKANFAKAQNVLGFFLLAEENTELAHKYFAEAAKAGIAAAMYNLALSFLRKGETELGHHYILQAANNNLAEACYYWAYYLLQIGDIDNSFMYLQKARHGFNPAVLALALLLDGTGKFDVAEHQYKEAIQLGVANAEIFYAHFLSRQGRHDEALSYQKFHEEILSPADIKTIEEGLLEEKPSEILLPEVQPDLSTVIESEVKETKVRDSSTGISKRLQRLYDRAENERTAKLQIGQPIREAKPPRSYKDIKIFGSAKVESEITKENEIKIKSLISALANNEMRGRFKPLKGYKKLYAMRISKKDRLVFKIREGDIKNDIKAIKIISALGHYNNLDIKTASKAEVREIRWTEK